jgi:hypothetical protein
MIAMITSSERFIDPQGPPPYVRCRRFLIGNENQQTENHVVVAPMAWNQFRSSRAWLVQKIWLLWRKALVVNFVRVMVTFTITKIGA